MRRNFNKKPHFPKCEQMLNEGVNFYRGCNKTEKTPKKCYKLLHLTR